MRRGGLLLATVCIALMAQTMQAQAAPEPLPPGAVRPAIEGVLDAFQTHPLVGLGDAHSMAQQLDFYAALVRDPRFAAEVGNVVVEFGGAAHQSTIDRYVAGENVPYAELRNVWTNTVGWVPLPGSIGFMNFFAQVRATNAALLPERRIRVWLGEPPIDWAQVKDRADLDKLGVLRDSHPAEVIDREILRKNKKALVIYGTGHFMRGRSTVRPSSAAGRGAEAALKRLLVGLAEGAPPYDAMTPASANMTHPFAAARQAAMADYGPLRSMTFQGRDIMDRDVFDVAFANQPVRASILLDDEGKIASHALWPPGGLIPNLVENVEAKRPGAFFIVLPYTGYGDAACSERFEAAVGAAPAVVRAPGLLQDLKAAGCGEDGLLDLADAVLFVGRRADLTTSPYIPDLYLDEDYRREIGRRYEIMVGRPMPALTEVQPVAPNKFRP